MVMMERPSPFHWGEQQVQTTVGVRQEAEELGRGVIRGFMPEQHRIFYANQPLFFLASQDLAGGVWASVVSGRPGFISSPDNTHIVLAPGSFTQGDPLNLALGSRVGGLGIELTTRRRNRINGTVVARQADGSVVLRVDQSFGNCPKYIQSRDLEFDHQQQPSEQQQQQQQQQQQHGTSRQVMESQGAVGPEQRAVIARSDTFFIATASVPRDPEAVAAPPPRGSSPSAPSAQGCDVSHRGGPPGFVQLAPSGASLRWPDYSGNNMFQTLGNLMACPSAGLLFVDFDSGDVLQLTGEAVVHFDQRDLPGAQRAVEFQVHKWRHVRSALPITRSHFLNASPFNPRPAGPPSEAAEQLALPCTGVRLEAQGIKTYEFKVPATAPGAAAGGGSTAFSYRAGQYASFDLEGEDEAGEPLVLNRTWTISSVPEEVARSGRFTITVKRKEGGLVSPWLWDNMRPGLSLRFKGVGGDFVVPKDPKPALLIAGGIGITPMRVIFHELVRRGTPATLLYSVRDGAEAAFLQELQQLASSASEAAAGAAAAGEAAAGAAAAGPAADAAPGVAASSGSAQPSPAAAPFQAVATATGDAGEAWPGLRGRLTGSGILKLVPDVAQRQVYICGPQPFMAQLVKTLEGELGVPSADIFQEEFSF